MFLTVVALPLDICIAIPTKISLHIAHSTQKFTCGNHICFNTKCERITKYLFVQCLMRFNTKCERIAKYLFVQCLTLKSKKLIPSSLSQHFAQCKGGNPFLKRGK